MRKVSCVFIAVHFFFCLFGQDTDTTETIETFTEQDTIITNTSYVSSTGRLRYYGAEGEDFFVSNNYSTVVRVTDGKLTQKNYDEKQRLVKETVWEKDSPAIESITEFAYEIDTSNLLSSKKDDYNNMQRTTILYNTEGFITEKKIFLLVQKEMENKLEDAIENDFEEKTDVDVIDSVVLEKTNTIGDEVPSEDISEDTTTTENVNDTIEKDSEENTTDITEETTMMPVDLTEIDEEKTELLYTKSFEYNDENLLVKEATEYSDISQKSERIEYAFNLGEKKADTFTFLDNALQASVVYSSPVDWAETTFFPRGLYIKETYVDGTLVRNEVFENDIKIRERLYETTE